MTTLRRSPYRLTNKWRQTFGGTTAGGAPTINELNPNRIVIAPSTATPAGNDANAGTDAAPVRTMTRALVLWNAAGTPRPWIYLRGGTYALNTTTDKVYIGSWAAEVTATPTAASPLIIRNYPTEIPILIGTAVAGNWATPTGSTAAYWWIHGISLDDFDDSSGNGGFSTILAAQGPWRYTAISATRLGTRVADAGGDFTDHGLYLGHLSNQSNLPCQILGFRNYWDPALTGAPVPGASIHSYNGTAEVNSNFVEVAYCELIGGAWGMLVGGASNWRIHHNSILHGLPANNTRVPINLGEYTSAVSDSCEVDHNVLWTPNNAAAIRSVAGLSTNANIHDNWFAAGAAAPVDLSGTYTYAASNYPSTTGGANPGNPLYVATTDLHLQGGSPVPAGMGAFDSSRNNVQNLIHGPCLVNGVFTW